MSTTPSSASPRVALVTNVLSHYRVPCFQRLAAALPGRFDLFLLTDRMAHRHYVMAREDGGLAPTVLPGRSFRRPPDDDFHWNSIGPVLRGRYDVLILGGWSEPTLLWLWLRHQLRPTKIFFWTESTRVDRRRAPSRELLKRTLMRGAAGCLVPGERAAAYCEHLGMPRGRIFTAPNATDRDFFRSRADALLPERETLRRTLGLEGPTVLFVGRLVESIKGVESVIRALGRLAGEGVSAGLVLAGEGPDAEPYQALADGLGVDLRRLGNVPHEALCRWYAAADLLVLPSRSEVWGFVLNEAMEFGLPLVVSDAVGAADDLVQDGVHGAIVPVGDIEGFATALGPLLTDPDLRRRQGEACRRQIERYSPERWAAGVVEAVAAVTAVAAVKG